MIWFAASVILGVLALGFLVSGLRNLWIEELLAAAILILGTYFTAVKAGLIQSVV